MLKLTSKVLVLGGGIAGMEAAASLADMGLDVLLIERGDHLGGHAAQWACMATDSCGKCSACLIEDTINRIDTHPKVRVLTHADVESVNREKGKVTLVLKPARGSVKERTGKIGWQLKEQATVEGQAVVLATGFNVFEAKDQRLMGYGHLPEVVTTEDLDEVLKTDDFEGFLPTNGANQRIAFIQCVGSRDRSQNREYCSQFCCKTSIRLANRLLYLRPELEITIYYIDLQIMGKEFRTFYEEAKDKIRFRQGVPAEVRPGSEVGSVKVVGIDPTTGLGEIEEYNRIVLSVGMVANPRNNRLIEQFGLETNEFGFIASLREEGAVATSQPGVYLAGACAGPADIQVSRLQAMAAAKRVAVDLMGSDTAHDASMAG